jgi:hypothetical protein
MIIQGIVSANGESKYSAVKTRLKREDRHVVLVMYQRIAELKDAFPNQRSHNSEHFTYSLE